MSKRICSIDGCENPFLARGWCNKHYIRWKNHGAPLAPVKEQRVRKIQEGHDRVCLTCGVRKVASEFSATRADCKACRRNRENQRYAGDVKRRKVENAQRRRDEFPDLVREQDRQRYERHRGKRIALATTTMHRRRARMLAVDYDETLTRSNLRRQCGDRCHYCDVQMTFKVYPRGVERPQHLATVEHVIPISRGGAHIRENVVLACWACNMQKKARTLDEWTPPNRRSRTDVRKGVRIA